MTKFPDWTKGFVLISASLMDYLHSDFLADKIYEHGLEFVSFSGALMCFCWKPIAVSASVFAMDYDCTSHIVDRHF